jgi:hypothetical protein
VFEGRIVVPVSSRVIEELERDRVSTFRQKNGNGFVPGDQFEVACGRKLILVRVVQIIRLESELGFDVKIKFLIDLIPSKPRAKSRSGKNRKKKRVTETD